MSADKEYKLPVFVLGLVVVLSLSLANVAVATDRTLLNEQHAKDSMEEEGVYSSVTDDVKDRLVEEMNNSIEDEQRRFIDQEQMDQRMQSVADKAVTKSYIRGEINRNLENLYGFILEGEEDVRLSTNLSEPKQNAAEEIQNDTLVAGFVNASQVDEQVPDERNLTTDGEVPGAMENVQSAAGIIGLLKFLLPLLAIGLIAAVYFLTKSPHRTGNTAGAALIVSGVLGLLIGFGAGGPIAGALDSALEAESSEAQAFADGFVTAIEGLFDVLVTQSIILTVAGIGAMGLVYADKEGYLEGVKAALPIGESQAQAGGQYQQGQQGQYQQGQQGQYQQGQQGQYQQGQQGQYQQGQQGQYQQGQQGQYQQGQQGEYQQGQGDQYQQGQGGQYQQGQGDQYQQDQGGQYQQGQGDQYQQDQGGQYQQGQQQDQYQQGGGQYDQGQYDQQEGGQYDQQGGADQYDQGQYDQQEGGQYDQQEGGQYDQQGGGEYDEGQYDEKEYSEETDEPATDTGDESVGEREDQGPGDDTDQDQQ